MRKGLYAASTAFSSTLSDTAWPFTKKTSWLLLFLATTGFAAYPDIDIPLSEALTGIRASMISLP